MFSLLGLRRLRKMIFRTMAYGLAVLLVLFSVLFFVAFGFAMWERFI